MFSFTIENKKVQIWPGTQANQPVIYLHTFGEEGPQVFSQLDQMLNLQKSSQKFSLAAISSLDWNHDMVPWDIPAVFKNGEPYTGGADDYLKLLTKTIMPQTEKYIKTPILWRGLAGYSLAGLFSIYAMYRTDAFSRFASMSGSLWFPEIIDFIRTHSPQAKPSHIYFSLGNKECRTRNPYLKIVQDNTEIIQTFYRNHGIHTAFELNSGNHFQDAAKRTAKGISWLLKQ